MLTDSCAGNGGAGGVGCGNSLGQQGVDVGRPSVDVGGVRLEAARHRLTHQRRTRVHTHPLCAYGIGGPECFDHPVAHRVRLTIGGHRRPVLDDAAGIACGF